MSEKINNEIYNLKEMWVYLFRKPFENAINEKSRQYSIIRARRNCLRIPCIPITKI